MLAYLYFWMNCGCSCWTLSRCTRCCNYYDAEDLNIFDCNVDTSPGPRSVTWRLPVGRDSASSGGSSVLSSGPVRRRRWPLGAVGAATAISRVTHFWTPPAGAFHRCTDSRHLRGASFALIAQINVDAGSTLRLIDQLATNWHVYVQLRASRCVDAVHAAIKYERTPLLMLAGEICLLTVMVYIVHVDGIKNLNFIRTPLWTNERLLTDGGK